MQTLVMGMMTTPEYTIIIIYSWDRNILSLLLLLIFSDHLALDAIQCVRIMLYSISNNVNLYWKISWTNIRISQSHSTQEKKSMHTCLFRYSVNTTQLPLLNIYILEYTNIYNNTAYSFQIQWYNTKLGEQMCGVRANSIPVIRGYIEEFFLFILL